MQRKRAYAYTRTRAYSGYKRKQLSSFTPQQKADPTQADKKGEKRGEGSEEEEEPRNGSRCPALWFFSNHKRENNLGIFSLISFSLFLLSRDTICHIPVTILVPALLVGFYEPQSVPPANTSAGKTTQTTVHLYGRLGYKWLLYMPAYREPDLQATITPWFANIPYRRNDMLHNTPSSVVRIRDYTSSWREKRM